MLSRKMPAVLRAALKVHRTKKSMGSIRELLPKNNIDGVSMNTKPRSGHSPSRKTLTLRETWHEQVETCPNSVFPLRFHRFNIRTHLDSSLLYRFRPNISSAWHRSRRVLR